MRIQVKNLLLNRPVQQVFPIQQLYANMVSEQVKQTLRTKTIHKCKKVTHTGNGGHGVDTVNIDGEPMYYALNNGGMDTLKYR